MMAFRTVRLRSIRASQETLYLLTNALAIASTDSTSSEEDVDEYEYEYEEERSRSDEYFDIPKEIFIKLKDHFEEANMSQYGASELRHLLTIMEEVLPVGNEQWELVVQKHTEVYPGRDVNSIRRKYNSLTRKKAPTGNPNLAWDVKWVRRIMRKYMAKVELGFARESYDLAEGHSPPALRFPDEANAPTVDAPSEAAVVLPPVPPLFVAGPAIAAPAVATDTPTAAERTDSARTSGVSRVTGDSNPSRRSYNRTSSMIDAVKDIAGTVAKKNAESEKRQEKREEERMMMFASAINGLVSVAKAYAEERREERREEREWRREEREWRRRSSSQYEFYNPYSPPAKKRRSLSAEQQEEKSD